MDMSGEYRIPAPRQLVWEGLNDPETLKAVIPGCDELTKVSDTELTAKVTAKVGPVKASFGGKVTLSDLNPPESYTISGEGTGGAGFAKGGAKVFLTEDGDGTILRYEAAADVGGKLAQIGSRLIQGTAKKMADDFFGKFSAVLAARSADGSLAAATPMAVSPPVDELPAVIAMPVSVEPIATAAEVPAPPAPAMPPPEATTPPVIPVAPVPPPPPAATPIPPSVATRIPPTPRAPVAPAIPPMAPATPPAAKLGFMQKPTVWGLIVVIILFLLYRML